MEQNLRILLVEDSAPDAESMARELERAKIDFSSLRVETEEDFLRGMKEFKPHVVLADYSLSRFTGLEALRLLQRRENPVPFILVTGSHSERVVVECMREGAEDYILKSSMRHLPTAVLNAVRKRDAELKKEAAEAAYRRSQEQYRLITENSRDLICLLGLEFHFIYASPSFQRVLGHDPRDVINSSCLELIHPDDADALREALDQALVSRKGRNAELRFRHTGGEWQTFDSAANVIFGATGQPERILIVSRDLTDRKKAEQEIRKLAAFPQFNPNPVLEFAADGTLTYFNDAALEMARSIGMDHPQAILPLTAPTVVKMSLASGQARLHLETHAGNRVLSWSFFPVVANKVVHCYAEDITSSLNLEAQLRQVLKMESVGQLAAGVAHDFNNILTIIHGHAGLLLAEPSLDSPQAESVRQISMAAERAANLTRQLLMFSRKQMMQPQLLDLSEVVNNLAKMLRAIVGEQIIIKRQTASDLPAINADPGMMEQVIVNLVVNARDAMSKGGTLTVSTCAVEIDEGYAARSPEARVGHHVCLSVSDTGHGMDSAIMSRIFEPFFTTKEAGRGTGLGLATVYGIIKQHLGWAEVESQVGQGTTFRIFLPVASKAPPRPDDGSSCDVPGGSETILLVEDEPLLRELVQEILQKKGYHVLGAASGVQALDVWRDHKDGIELLLTDMMMPEGISGRELAEILLAEKPTLKVVYSSGYSLDVISPDFTFQPGTVFLQKPYQPETLAQMVRECLDTARHFSS